MAKHTIEGQWHTTSKDAHGFLFHDVQRAKEEVSTRPIEEQGEWESRKLWHLVAKGIREGDFETASREKSKIEVIVHFTYQSSNFEMEIRHQLTPSLFLE